DESEALILIVDDSDDVREWWEFVLVGLRYAVVSTTDGKTALRLTKELRPDLVLLDVALPEVGALEFLERLPRNVPAPPPVIAVSGYNALEPRAMARGARAFLKKPVTTSDLIDTIERVLADQLPLS